MIEYRGTKPAHIVSVLEGNGVDIPFEKIEYVLTYEDVGGLARLCTIGKVVPLTEEERAGFI